MGSDLSRSPCVRLAHRTKALSGGGRNPAVSAASGCFEIPFVVGAGPSGRFEARCGSVLLQPRVHVQRTSDGHLGNQLIGKGASLSRPRQASVLRPVVGREEHDREHHQPGNGPRHWCPRVRRHRSTSAITAGPPTSGSCCSSRTRNACGDGTQDLPQQNADHYRAASPISHAGGLRGSLLLMHGSGDDNVHFQGSQELINRLVRLG